MQASVPARPPVGRIQARPPLHQLKPAQAGLVFSLLRFLQINNLFYQWQNRADRMT